MERSLNLKTKKSKEEKKVLAKVEKTPYDKLKLNFRSKGSIY